MSDPVTALGGMRYDGFVTVSELGPQGMIALRGDLASSAFHDLAKDLVGPDFPRQGEMRSAGERTLAWMSPDELLLMLPYAEAPAALTRIAETLAGTHHLAADVSDARAVFRLAGGQWREVLAKLTPADVSPRAFAPPMFRRTRLAQVPAAFWIAEPDAVQILCFRSVARYVFDLLATSARPGSAAGVFRP